MFDAGTIILPELTRAMLVPSADITQIPARAWLNTGSAAIWSATCCRETLWADRVRGLMNTDIIADFILFIG
jgi:hypothetical protein